MKPRVWPALLFSTLAAAPAWAQIPVGGEFQVNAYTTRSQFGSSVASDASGNFVVAWTSDGQDGSGYGVFARRYNASGAPLGPEFRVNAYTTGRQAGPSVASNGAGSFVVAWMSDGQDGSGRGVFARRYDGTGSPQGPEFQVNTYTTGGQGGVSVGVEAAGHFVIAWAGAGEGDGYGIFGQRYDASGAPRGSAFRVNSYTTGDQGGPDVATDAAGNFVIAWSSRGGFEVGQFGILAHRYAASGASLGANFRVDTPNNWAFFFSTPSVVMDQPGNFVVVFSRVNYFPPSPGMRGSGEPGDSGVFGQRFGASGARRGAEFAATSSFLTLHTASAASDAAGHLLVAWDRQQDGSGSGIFARRYEPSGAPSGAAFRVNSYVQSDQLAPAVGADPSGRLFAAWTSTGQDGDSHGVFAQRFGDVLPAALILDTAASFSSNGNLVLEAGESVDVGPFWRNVTGAALTFNGTALSFTGPAAGGVGYQLQDAAGGYGTVADGATAVCINCYQVGVTSSGTRPALHWDATLTEMLTPAAHGQTKPWTLHVGESFTDVPKASPYYRFVETLLHKGITAGCAAGVYCPANLTTREQMPAFVLLAREGAAYAPAPCSPPNVFADVPETSVFCDVIEELSRRGVVSGCGGGNYCPGSAVSREEMPVFVLRVLEPALDPPACTTPRFADVPASSPFCRWIEELARRGVVTGCGGGNYCPAAPVTREQMAVFVTATFGLKLYGP